MKLLKQLYLIYSPSHHENRMSDFVQSQLDGMNIKYKTNGNIIYSIKKNTPLICAHMDQVSNYPIIKVKQKKDIVYSDGNLGADDKNGIWICLNLLKQFPDISFIFSDQEEIGGNITELLWKYRDILKSVKYGLIFDRKNGADIVCSQNRYGTKKFEKALSKTGKFYGYIPAIGSWSDCDELSNYISCCNLSCGYYKPHTAQEYTKFSELNNALQYGIAILNNITKQYGPVENRWGKKTSKKHTDTYNLFNDDFDDGFTEPHTGTEIESDYFYCDNCDSYFTLEEIGFNEVCPYCNCFLRKFKDVI